MNEHTPGPWDKMEYDGWLYVGGSEMDIVEYDPVNEPYNVEVQNAVCVIGFVDNLMDVDYANSWLIAAAPDLLAACEELLRVMDNDFKYQLMYSDGRDEALELAKAAVAKASGE